MLPWVDAVVLSAPLFVNAAPSHVVTFLEKGEHQNEMHLRIYEGWCQRAGISWGGLICLFLLLGAVRGGRKGTLPHKLFQK